MIRRIGEQFRPDVRYRYRHGVYAILPRDGELLLTFQEEPAPELQLPGGGVDAGENPVRALYREVLEETGWSIAAPRRLGAYRRYTYMPEYDMWAEKICTIYVARPVRQLGPPHEEGHTALWASPGFAADAVASPGDRHFVRRFLSRF